MSTARRTRRSPFEFGNDCAYDRGSLHRDREERGPDPRAEAPRCRLASAARYFQAVGQMAKVLALRGKSARREGPENFKGWTTCSAPQSAVPRRPSVIVVKRSSADGYGAC